MTSVNIQIFEEFIKFHIPIFTEDNRFCVDWLCSNCKAYYICNNINQEFRAMKLSKEEMNYAKIKYPEVFI